MLAICGPGLACVNLGTQQNSKVGFPTKMTLATASNGPPIPLQVAQDRATQEHSGGVVPGPKERKREQSWTEVTELTYAVDKRILCGMYIWFNDVLGRYTIDFYGLRVCIFVCIYFHTHTHGGYTYGSH